MVMVLISIYDNATAEVGVSMLSIFAQGFFLQASLVLALGAQNIFVLNSGLRKQRHLFVATICSICDAILIFIGVLGVATFFIQFPLLKILLGIVGVGFLFFYGGMKLKEAKDGAEFSPTSVKAVSIKKTVLTTLGFTLLNPHVYLDTFVLIGGYSSKFNAVIERFYFGAGASALSVIWFFGLSLLASFASRLLSNAKAMRGVSLVSGLILIFLAVKLGSDVLGWIREA